jgi:hypothetical protein
MVNWKGFADLENICLIIRDMPFSILMPLISYCPLTELQQYFL